MRVTPGKWSKGTRWSGRCSRAWLSSSGDEGLHAAATTCAELPHAGVLVLSQYVRESYALQLLADDAAAAGYLLKQRVMELDGFARAPGGRARRLRLRPRGRGSHARASPPAGPIDGLTPTERDALGCGIFAKLALPSSPEGHRRVLAALTYLRAQER